jgi:dTDP-4-dehydrorhamnose reductase
VRYFTGRGHDVVATFHTFPHYLHQVAGCQSVQLDLANGTAIDQVVARFQPDVILHTAALSRPQQHTDPDYLHAVNVAATGRLARAASMAGSGIIYLSTDLVYPSFAGLCNEETPVDPSGAGGYSRSKLLGEDEIRSAADRWTILRCTLMFGDGTPRSNSFSQFIDRKWGAGEPAPLFSDQYRSFLYVGDLLTAIEQVALIAPRWNELYVCGGAERMSRADFGLRYASISGVDHSMCNVMRSDQLEGYVGGGSDIELDCSKLRDTGWKPRSLDECFMDMLCARAAE